jgi:hypothetical protein
MYVVVSYDLDCNLLYHCAHTQTPWDNLRELEVRRECARALANMCAVPSLGTQLIAALRTPAQAHSAEVLLLLLLLLLLLSSLMLLLVQVLVRVINSTADITGAANYAGREASQLVVAYGCST